MFKWVLAILIAIISRKLMSNFQQDEERLENLGGEVAPIVPSWAPFGAWNSISLNFKLYTES